MDHIRGRIAVESGIKSTIVVLSVEKGISIRGGVSGLDMVFAPGDGDSHKHQDRRYFFALRVSGISLLELEGL